MTRFHGALVSFASAGAGDIRPLYLPEGCGAVSLRQLQCIGHRNIGCCEFVARQIGRACELPPHQPEPALEYFQRLAGTPILPVGLGRQIEADNDEVDGRGETGLAEMEELLVGGEGRIVRGRRERRRSVAGPSATP